MTPSKVATKGSYADSGRNSEPDKSILELLLYLEFSNAVFL